ncbi:nicotinamide/nicotinic acid mononucleotide adenylyltransferase 1 isoform X1 [Schistocerca nitens]|uniref:nicotinamide/nicotinic acid mononucleotide adenylyltransferase 1 isoform X1 n=1 Tax=Schistocerca nitens TaxID=7011 RepID=UPI002118E668|nr:nicotinamide/nicotinic acid mononucleotide adenylyltransferase 1 isoform X1 [Schistocerca nitens]
MTQTKVLLVACGAYNPPTHMHLRMFEIARDHLQRLGYKVIGGVVSPVHDAYEKNDLLSSTHRCAMLQLALKNSDWIKLSTWECQQDTWSRTRFVLQHHQNQLNSVLNDCNDSPNKRQRRDDLQWIPDDLKLGCEKPVQVKLLCGADFLESFGVPGLWADEDIETILGQHGLVVITREGSNPYKFIYESDILSKYQNNIVIVTEWIANEISSTKIRRALRRSETVKYLIPDSVIDYIQKNSLYKAKDNKYLYPEFCGTQPFLTPSPSDVNMDSPSPNTQITALTYDCEFQNKKNSEQNDPCVNVPVTYIRVEHISGEHIENEVHYAERLSNDENSKRSAIGYPGQAVQIISTPTGDRIAKQGLTRPACLL